MSDLPPEFLELIGQVKGKRARTVVSHILEHGFITTETLKNVYGYDHPPRAIRDVKEQGIPIERYAVKNESGRTIAAYRFGTVSSVQVGRLGGRKPIPRSQKKALVAAHGVRCSVCAQEYDQRFLQVDHRIPYEVAGESLKNNFMLICRSCNRAKSWACEHCQNWLQDKQPIVCTTCYWCNSESYTHVSMLPLRRLEIVWTGEETPRYEMLKEMAAQRGESLAAFVKQLLANAVRDDKSTEG